MWHCKGSGPKDLVTFDFVNISPKFISRKVPAVVNASGALSETVGEDVTVEISVKYNMVPIKIINRKDPLCTLLPQIGLSCPVEAGPITFQGEVKLPDRFMPPGIYHVHLNAYITPGKPLLCIDTDLKLKQGMNVGMATVPRWPRTP